MENSTIQPIETHYAGRFFRSRLEARWGVFFNAIGIPWFYEPEGFRLKDDVLYLPDFYLPHLACFVEIKPVVPTQDEMLKCELLAKASGKKVFLFYGIPGYHVNGGYPPGQIGGDGAYSFSPLFGTYSRFQAWCVCQKCGRRYGIKFYRKAAVLTCPCQGGRHREWAHDDPHLLVAYDKANSARF